MCDQKKKENATTKRKREGKKSVTRGGKNATTK